MGRGTRFGGSSIDRNRLIVGVTKKLAIRTKDNQGTKKLATRTRANQGVEQLEFQKCPLSGCLRHPCRLKKQAARRSIKLVIAQDRGIRFCSSGVNRNRLIVGVTKMLAMRMRANQGVEQPEFQNVPCVVT